MELLERLFSLRERAGRVGGRRDSPLVPVSPDGDPPCTSAPQNPPRRAAGPVLAVAAVLAVALGRAVAPQQATLAVVGVLHRVLLPVHLTVVLYHAAEGESAGLIWGSHSPSPTGAAGGKPGAALARLQELGDIPSATASPGDPGHFT